MASHTLRKLAHHHANQIHVAHFAHYHFQLEHSQLMEVWQFL